MTLRYGPSDFNCFCEADCTMSKMPPVYNCHTKKCYLSISKHKTRKHKTNQSSKAPPPSPHFTANLRLFSISISKKYASSFIWYGSSGYGAIRLSLKLNFSYFILLDFNVELQLKHFDEIVLYISRISSTGFLPFFLQNNCHYRILACASQLLSFSSKVSLHFVCTSFVCF